MKDLLFALEGAVFTADGSNDRYLSFQPGTSIPQVRDQLRTGDVKVLLKQQAHRLDVDYRGNPVEFSAPPEYGVLYVDPQLLTTEILAEQGVDVVHPVGLYVRAKDNQIYPLYPQDHVIYLSE